MIEEYIHKALEKTKYKIIEDKEPYYGEVGGLSIPPILTLTKKKLG